MEHRLRCWRRRSLYEPEDQALCLGGEALSFAVDYEQGTGSPSYQWYSSTTSAGFGVPLAEATDRHVHATCFCRWRDVVLLR